MRHGMFKTTAVLVSATWMLAGCSTGSSDQAEVQTGGPGGPGGAHAQVVGESQAIDASSPGFLGEVAKKTCEKATTGQVAAELKVSDLSGFMFNGASGSVTLSGSFDVSAERAEMTVDASGVSDLVAPIAGMNTTGAVADLAGSLDQPIRVIVDGDAAYVNWSLAREFAKADTDWVQVSAPQGADGESDGVDPFDDLDLLDEIDGCGFAELIRTSEAGMAEVGSEEIDGVATTHYTGTFDVEASLEQLPEGVKDEIEEPLAKVGDAAKVPVDVWVGEDGAARRLVVDYDLSGLGMGVTGTVNLTVNLTGLGEPVTITAPSADQVTVLDMKSLLGAVGGADMFPGHN